MNLRATIGSVSPALALNSAGAGLKPAHFAQILAARPKVGFFEIHAENYMNAGGPNHRWLAAIREHYPLSVHGVGLSLGSTELLNREHLARLKQVVTRTRPALVSEHLAWCDAEGRAFPDLLPLPYDEAALGRIAGKITATQEALGREILIENPATYLRFHADSLAETQFLAELCARAGCGLLLDVNNVFVSAVNHGFDAQAYLDALPLERVGEIHLAGHAEARDAEGAFLIDDHGGPVSEAVWALYRRVVARGGARPTLIEWDNNIPDWPALHAETIKANAILAAAPPVSAPAAQDAAKAGVVATATEHWQTAFAAALDDPASPVPQLFTPGDAAARFSVYRNNSAVATIGALREQFPSVLRLVGDDAFSGLARAFVRKSPPISPVLGDYGAGFPDFILAFLAESGAKETPYLPDVARLDWVRLRALRAEEAKPCGMDRLAALDPAQIGAVRAAAHPSCGLVVSEWPLSALIDPETTAIDDWCGESLLVLRPEAEIRLLPVSLGQATFFAACLTSSISAAVECAAGADDSFDFGRALVALTSAGAFVDFLLEEGTAP